MFSGRHLDRSRLLAELWANFEQSAAWSFVAEQGAAVVLAGVALLLVLLWLGGRAQKRQRTKLMLRAVNDATFGRTVPRSRTGAWGFAVALEPPPERFREFNISYHAMSIYDPIDLGQRLLAGRRATLQIAGVLTDAPSAELIWWRGKLPAHALGSNPGRAPWVQGRLDFAGAVYATRGTNVGAMQHVFRDMYARFTPLLRSITVQRERRPQVRLVAAGRIDTRDVSPLIQAAHALGRAALLE